MRTASTDNGMGLTERYDREDDVYYVTVKTGEPSLAEEYDDRLILEKGIFTGLPTGFRILNYSKYKSGAGDFKDFFNAICKKTRARNIKDLETKQKKIERQFGEFLEKAAK